MGNSSADFFNLKIHGYSLWNCAAMLYISCYISFPCLWTVILDLRLSLASHGMVDGFIEFSNLENMGVAVGILQLCCIYKLRYKYFRFVSRHLGFPISACITQYEKKHNWIPQPWKHECCRWNFAVMLHHTGIKKSFIVFLEAWI